MSSQTVATLRYVRGFTLVEALVALLVLSIGLLGVAGMQLKALQSAHTGYQRSIASLIAQDAVELLWSKVDLSSDACPSISAINGENWASRWEEFLPGFSMETEPPPQADNDSDPQNACMYKVKIIWNEGRFREENPPVFIYTARLPKGSE